MLSKREAIFGLGILAAFGALGVEVIKKQPTKEERIKLLKKEIKHFEAHLEKLNNGELPDHLKERRLSKELNEKIRLQMINATETYLRNLRFTLKASER
jgi:cytochrome c556